MWQEIAVVLLMTLILLGSVIAPGPSPGGSQSSMWAWVIVFGLIALAELALVAMHRPSLSSQMQAWVLYGRAGRIMALWWLYISYHLVLEPLVRGWLR